MVGEEMRRSSVSHFLDLSADYMRRLRQIYYELARSLPNDPAAPPYIRLTRSAATTPLALSAKPVLQTIARAAVAYRALPITGEATAEKPLRRTSDALTE